MCIYKLESIKDCFTLNNGVKIPCIGFGTYAVAGADNCDVLNQAIKSGYRYFDTASFYKTESYLAQAVEQSGIVREEFFIASKAWKSEMGYHQVNEAFERSLSILKTDYLDLYLIHWPLPCDGCKDWKQIDNDTWKAMEELYSQGRIKAIGLSNFLPHHIENILENCEIKPMVDQLEIHPGYSQTAAVDYCIKNDILVQAWSPIGRGRVFGNELIVELADKYSVSEAQLCLKYVLEKGIIPLPKASSIKRMYENQDIFSFEINQEDMYRLETMPQTGWSGEHPDLPAKHL